MRLCTDENVGEDTVVLLRQCGHDVLWIRETAPGITDTEVLERANASKRLLITFDKDFGELVYSMGANASCGIILFRFGAESAADCARKVVAALETRGDWPGHFSVISESTVRMRPLRR